jgi:Mrp family chromosome partitioning ATPase
MNIWEEVYYKHKESGGARLDPQIDQNHNQQQDQQILPESVDGPSKTADSGSLEEAYYKNGKPQPVNQHAQDQAPEPQVSIKPVKARFIPRVQSDKLTASYPALLSKMRYSLSDCWANIMLETKQNVQTLLVCGAAGKEGVTLISFHLAMFLSKEYSMKVLYVDTNLNHKAIPRIQNLPGVYSFVSDASENKDLASLIVQTEYPGLYLLPSGAGTIEKNVGGNMLAHESIESLIQFCRNNFDMTIIDGQPLVSSPVMIEFARVADMTLLACRYGFSRHEVSKLAIDKLQKFGITSIGVVLNDRKFPVPQKVYKMMG